MSWKCQCFFAKKKLYVYVFMSAPKKVNKNIQKVYPCLISSFSILSLCASQKVKASFFTLHFHNRAKTFFNCTFNLDPRPPSFSSCKSPPQKTFCHGHRRFPLGWQPLQRGTQWSVDSLDHFNVSKIFLFSLYLGFCCFWRKMFSISKSTTGGQEMYWGGLEWLVLAGGQIEKSEWNGKRRRRRLH